MASVGNSKKPLAGRNWPERIDEISSSQQLRQHLVTSDEVLQIRRRDNQRRSGETESWDGLAPS